MLQNVHFINYRGLKDTTIPLAPITLLTGTNGIGKTSVLEGLYFLLTEQVPDAAVFPRYQPIHNRTKAGEYDYLSFWKECPTSGASVCQVEADLKTQKLSWEMKISDFSGIDEEFKRYELQRKSGNDTLYVSWEWKSKETNSSQFSSISKAVQQLIKVSHDSLRNGDVTSTACRYVDMPSIKHVPDTLPLQTEKLLTRALRIINSEVTGVRYDGIPGRLRIIIKDEYERSLGALGVGAETWGSVLLVLAELISISTKDKSSVMFLVDEIGAGIHYSKQEEMWGFLLKFLSEYPQIQMVLTTHSYDCIKAFCKTFQNANPGMAQIVRLHTFGEKDGIKTTTYSHDTFENILQDEWEVRG